MPESETYDLLVLGGGMAGLPVSIKSAHKGLNTALVEQDLLGGTCLNRGCIPTKTMIRSAEVANLIDRAEEFGIALDGDAETNMEERTFVALPEYLEQQKIDDAEEYDESDCATD